jgi:Spy/CpxP family protein refolding chaperone
MGAAQVTAMIDQLKRLTPEEREQVLGAFDAARDAEYLRERERARAAATADGIDDAAIDRAVEKVRYGR